MLSAVRDGTLYDGIRRAGLQHHVWQWQRYAAFCQYRRVYEATGRYLRPGALALDGYSFEAPPPRMAGEALFEHRPGAIAGSRATASVAFRPS